MARSKSNSSEGRIGLLFLIALSAALLFMQRDNAVDRRTTPLLASDVQAPIATLLSYPFRRLEGAIADVEDGRRALEENRALREELTELRARNERLQVMRDRQRRLEALLAVDRTGDIPDTRIAVRAVSDPSSPFVRSLLIGAGVNRGLSEGQPVHSSNGLVGHIVASGRRSSRVLRLDDLNSRVAVMSERTGARAILAGTNSEFASLAFVADPGGWAAGDRVLTSGDDGLMPQGLPVGEVRAEGDLSVALDFNRQPIDWVFVIPYQGLADAQELELDEMPDGTDDEADPTDVTETTLAPDPGAG